MKGWLSIIVLSLIVIFSCKLEPRVDEGEEGPANLPEDFIVFLDSFHIDSIYQMAHVRFPLQGIPAMMDTSYAEGNYHWEKSEWVMHQAFDPTNEEFEQIFTVFDENMIIERILHINRTMGMERRFAKSTDGWNLIYYAGMNFIRQNN